MFPVKVYFSRPNGKAKTLTAKNQTELDALKRIGWSTEPPKENPNE